MTTARYDQFQYLLGKRVPITGKFAKYGMNTGTGERTTCITDMTINNEPVNHLWINSTELAQARYRTGQHVSFTGKLTTRKRAPDNINDKVLLDIQIVKVQLNNKGTNHVTKTKHTR